MPDVKQRLTKPEPKKNPVRDILGVYGMMDREGPGSRIDLQPKQLRHFLEVAESGSISASCKILNITQPALSKSIKQLEQRLGVDLFDRLPTGVALTRYGKIFARRASLMEMEYRHALSEIDAAKYGASGTIRVGAGPGWIDTMLPMAITGFQRQHPRIKFTLESGVINTLTPRLLSGDLDVICCSLDFPSHPELVKEHLVDMKHVIFASVHHPLAQKKCVESKDLSDYPWITPLQDHVGRSRLESFFGSCGLGSPDIRAGIDSSFSTILKFVTLGNFLVSAPRVFQADAERFGLKVVFEDERLWKTPAGLIYRHTDKPHPMRTAFVGELREHFKTYVVSKGEQHE